MSSNPPGSCCYKGVEHEGNSVGRVETVSDFEVYITEAKDKSKENGILILTDVIGHRFGNAQLIADSFAANGYFVFMPDLFYGDAIKMNRPDDFDIMKWLQGEYNEKKTAHTPPVVDPIVEKSIKEMREKHGVKKIGAVGYCFGAKYVVRFLKPGQIDVGYSAHPSFVEDAELEAIKGPFAISAAETDSIFPAEKRHHSEEILKKTGQPYQINLYSGVEHGFAVRGDPKNRVVQYAKESAFLQAVQWFEEHIK
ncbi:hypothetical protein H2198_002499 [Neophaeococcomyces mojaviensis]|uniref:Uncharacterized protein n=1 Tax=Neophaeococcomyces mojaviensis TaxID=3383035 RepID=A0ACC3AE38_9EURO|nr:hypothetical protein H2198_002499 [Knufia sp. JES_112]